MVRGFCRLLVAGVALLFTATVVSAQSFGAFTWQLQPYCNRVTVSVTPQGPVFTLDGFDDQCGATTSASVVGIATLNSNGTVGLGMTTVTTPGGLPVHVDATLDLATLSGSWRDSTGGAGSVVFNGAAGGPPRPLSGGTISATQYNIGPVSVLSTPGTNNLNVGASAGTGSTGSGNTFVGAGTGTGNGTGSNNTFVGTNARPGAIWST